MSQIDYLINQSITRRSFLKGSVGVTLFTFLATASAGAVASLSGCTAATADITVTSSTDNNHSHKVTIPGADIDAKPSEKTYTSDGATHTHAITLKSADFAAVKNGQQITLTSTATGSTPHTHTFTIKKA